MSDEAIILIVFSLFLAGLVAIVVLFIRFLRKSKQEKQARYEETARLLTERGIASTAGEPFPEDLPVVPLIKKRGRPRVAIHAEPKDASLWVFEHFSGDRPPSGRNVEITSPSGESGSSSYYSRHTVACLRSRRLDLPEFEILPNFGSELKELVAASGIDTDSWQGKLTSSLVGMATAFGENRKPLKLDGRDDFASAYNVFADDDDRMRRLLDDKVFDWLVEKPGMIVCGHGSWLLLSRNVRQLPGGLPDSIDVGYLPAPDAAELALMAIDLSNRLT